jgi:hypothetical protein
MRGGGCGCGESSSTLDQEGGNWNYNWEQNGGALTYNWKQNGGGCGIDHDWKQNGGGCGVDHDWNSEQHGGGLEATLERACQGKSASQGGLNAEEFRKALVVAFPHRAQEIKGAGRAALNSICMSELDSSTISPKAFTVTTAATTAYAPGTSTGAVVGVKHVEMRGARSNGKRDCVMQEAGKYQSRPSPPYPANECCGEIMEGNDGQMWMSKADKNGVCRWSKAK